jgi:uncharacterized protein YkwD
VIGWLLLGGSGHAQRSEPAKKPDPAKVKEQIVATTNQFRRQEKRRELKVNPQLSQAAQAFAEFMARTDNFGHEADGKKPADRVTAAGYQYCVVAENIAYDYNSAGFSTEELAEGLIEGWRKSPEHRKNLLDPNLSEIGVGLAQSSKTGRYYTVQNLGRPKSEAIKFKLCNQTGETVKYTLDGQTHSVQPRYIMTHEICRPADIQLQQPVQNQASGDARTVFRPVNGGSYVTRKTDVGVYRIDKE